MKIRVSYTIDMDADSLRAFRAYNDHQCAALTDRELRDLIRSTAEQVGEMGLGEQISEGHSRLEAIAITADEAGQ